MVLFMSLSIVYSLVYQKKESVFKNTTKIWNETTALSQPQWYTETNIETSSNNTKDSDPINVSESVSLWDVTKSVSIWNKQNSDINIASSSVSLGYNMNMLPNTTEYFGTLDIVSILWQKPQFTLQDSRGNFFAYYGDHLDFVETVEALWWNVYEMITESEILQNQLFWDRVSYINLSVFKDIWVIMVIEIDGDVWLVQLPADKYHQSKDYLKSLFIH